MNQQQKRSEMKRKLAVRAGRASNPNDKAIYEAFVPPKILIKPDPKFMTDRVGNRVPFVAEEKEALRFVGVPVHTMTEQIEALSHG